MTEYVGVAGGGGAGVRDAVGVSVAVVLSAVSLVPQADPMMPTNRITPTAALCPLREPHMVERLSPEGRAAYRPCHAALSRSKERAPELTAVALEGADGDAQVITVAVDEVPRGRSNEC
jgi:hypothetical protein